MFIWVGPFVIEVDMFRILLIAKMLFLTIDSNALAVQVKSVEFIWGTYPIIEADIAAYPTPTNPMRLSWHQLEVISILSTVDRARLKEFRKRKFEAYKTNPALFDPKNNRVCWNIAAPAQLTEKDRNKYPKFLTAQIPSGQGEGLDLVSVIQSQLIECLDSSGENYSNNVYCGPNEDGSPKSAVECSNDPAEQIRIMNRTEFSNAFKPVRVKGSLVVETYPEKNK
jgi:hypothetical protein